MKMIKKKMENYENGEKEKNGKLTIDREESFSLSWIIFEKWKLFSTWNKEK